MALICPLYVKDGGVFDCEDRRVAAFKEISSPEELNQLKPEDEEADKVVIDLLDWQVCAVITSYIMEYCYLHLNI